LAGDTGTISSIQVDATGNPVERTLRFSGAIGANYQRRFCIG
jgi:hypothetical protein